MKKFLTGKKIILSAVFVLAVFLGAMFFGGFFQKTVRHNPQLYSAVYKAPFLEGMVMPASCSSGYYGHEACSAPIPPPTCSESFSPATIINGQSTSSIWSISNNTRDGIVNCTGDLGSSSFSPPPFSGTVTGLYPTATQTCTITVYNSRGTGSCSATITVNAPSCGDGFCSSASEYCSNCPQDCGACPPAPVCGDGICNGTETCADCSGDCGQCIENNWKEVLP